MQKQKQCAKAQIATCRSVTFFVEDITMSYKKTAIRSALAVSVAGLLGSTAAIATDFNGTASATVQTGVTIGETTSLSFGTLGVKVPTDMDAITVVTMAPSTGVLNSNAPAKVLVISDGTPLDLAITAGPPSASLTISQSGTATLAGTGANNSITLSTFVASAALLTDANGALNVKFGADLTFDVNSTYGAGTYSGAYILNVTF